MCRFYELMDTLNPSDWEHFAGISRDFPGFCGDFPGFPGIQRDSPGSPAARLVPDQVELRLAAAAPAPTRRVSLPSSLRSLALGSQPPGPGPGPPPVPAVTAVTVAAPPPGPPPVPVMVPPPPGPPRALRWPLAELLGATGGFSERHRVGGGGGGGVYRARLRDADYAVTRLRQDSDLDWDVLVSSFVTEVEKLSRYRHPNVVALAGACAERGHLCLVHVFVAGGSLERRLRAQPPQPPLTWAQRLHVLLGSARALRFLHRAAPPRVHGHLKSSHILLDAALTPRLSGLGPARAPRGGPGGGRSGSLGGSRALRGALAYLPPEHLRGGALAPPLDTYSFGVVLLETLTGRPALETDAQGRSRYLVYEELERLQGGALGGGSPPPPNWPEESPPAVLNAARRRLMARLALYEQGRLDSLGVLESGPPPGPPPQPEESDDFEP
ncbi:LOW QUALITY PROTEIN: interleukin-1 receptor-associated kinase 1 [Eudromia elegans]